MDLGIKIPNSVIVEGISVTKTTGVEDVTDFLKQYGCITRVEVIPESCSDFGGSLIIEFSSGEPIVDLRHILPYTLSSSDKTRNYLISELFTVYAEYMAKSKTQSYLTDLQEVAELSGMDFAEVLKITMAQIGRSVAKIHPAAEEKSLPAAPNAAVPPSKPSARSPASIIPPQETESKPHPASWQHTTEPGGREPSTMPDFNPPEVQRYVVEHIVKNEASVFPQKLKVFSGRLQRPAHEADYETWRSGVDLLLRDPSVSDLQRSRRIVDSLLPPAADVIKHLSTDALPSVYLDTLDSAYGAVQDGDELFAKFMDTFQNNGEKPSSYLHRLQVALNAAAKRGGVKDVDANRHLINQFCRGCWDNSLISELQLKQRKLNPPTFNELLLLLRTEEDREAAKNQRMKHHLGAVRQKATTHVQLAQVETGCEGGAVAALTSITQQLAEQLAEVQRQLAVLTANKGQRPTSSRSKADYSKQPAPRKSTPAQRKPGYCFRCGEDGHIRPQCQNEPNSSLVARKKKLVAQKQQPTFTNNQLN